MSSEALPVAAPSALDAATRAMDLAGRRLFPFRLERWLALGFVAFLDQCGRSGGSVPDYNLNNRFDRHPDFSVLERWSSGHVGLLIVIVAAGLALAVLLTALLLWLNSRGIFMYVDDVATGRADLARPWREHAELAGSLFAWRFGLAMIMLLAALIMGGGLVLIVAGPLRANAAVSMGRVVAGVALILMLMAAVFVYALAALALRDFVAPLQWRLRLPCGPAVRTFLGLLSARPGTFVVYVLLKLVFALAVALVSVALCCITCCIGILPVIFQTLLQPVFYFERAWSLLLLQQFGYEMVSPDSAA